MSEQAVSNGPLPVVPYLKGAGTEDPYLEGLKCSACDAIFLGARSTCSKCGARDQLKATRLENKGKLYSYSIVYRSFPGIDVPYISAIVDLDGGGTIKGNLIGIEADPSNLSFDMALDVVYGDALGRKDKAGNSYISYFFKPAV